MLLVKIFLLMYYLLMLSSMKIQENRRGNIRYADINWLKGKHKDIKPNNSRPRKKQNYCISRGKCVHATNLAWFHKETNKMTSNHKTNIMQTHQNFKQITCKNK